jgi:hypothetical protein
MTPAARLVARYRLLALAVLASAVLHAAIMFNMPRRIAAIEEDKPPLYEAVLQAPPAALPAPAAPARPPAAPRRPSARPPVQVPPDALAALPVETASDAGPETPPQLQPPPEMLALAQPATPVKALEPATFPVEALPPRISIDYQLVSSFAEGRATYRWERDGDDYRISGEAEAEGFFALFLEGRIVQESRGTVGPAGLRPDRFHEMRPNAGEEGLTFDWPGRTVTFKRGGDSRTTPLADNTVDWLSMIFQLAHVPPAAEHFEMQVFTQRRLYRFRLQVLGVEEIDIPLGRVRALHLRHADPAEKKENVDVWLGVDQHYLPVKLRYPVARNRLVVEQVATRVEKR